MAVTSRDEILKRVGALIGDRSDDDVLGLLDDITDTLDDYNTRITENGDWKSKYEENDKSWREKYRDRFYNAPETEEDYKDTYELEDEKKVVSYDDLFEVKENN